MIAQAGKTYAQIINGAVHWVFTQADLPEWADAAFTVVDITGLAPVPQPGWTYDGTAFTDPNAPTLEGTRTAKSAEISSACAAQIVGGQSSSALGSLHTYPTKPTDQSNLSASILDSLLPANTGNSAYVTPFWCMDSSGNWAWVNHTGQQIQQVGVDIKAAILAAQSKNAQLQAQIQAATTIDVVNAITW